MTASPIVKRMYAQLRAAWLHAARQPADKPFTIPASTKNDAVQLRFKLYNAVRDVRTGKVEDSDLLEALTRVKLSVVALPENRWGVLMAQKSEETDLLAALAAAGVAVEAPAEPPAPDFSGLMTRLQGEGLVPQPANAPPADPFSTKNPFYTRTGTGQSK